MSKKSGMQDQKHENRGTQQQEQQQQQQQQQQPAPTSCLNRNATGTQTSAAAASSTTTSSTSNSSNSGPNTTTAAGSAMTSNQIPSTNTPATINRPSPKRASLGGPVTTSADSSSNSSTGKKAKGSGSSSSNRRMITPSLSSATSAASANNPLWASCRNLGDSSKSLNFSLDYDEAPVPPAETSRPTPLRQHSLQSLHAKTPSTAGTTAAAAATTSATVLAASPTRKFRGVAAAGGAGTAAGGLAASIPMSPRLGHARSASASASMASAPPLPPSAANTTSISNNSSPLSLQAIMQEQEQERQQQQQQQAQQQEEENELTLDDLRILETAQEEELIALALERSLTDLGSNQPEGGGSHHDNNNNRTKWAQQHQQHRQDSTRSMNSSRSGELGGLWDSARSMNSSGGTKSSSNSTGRPPLRAPARPAAPAPVTALPPSSTQQQQSQHPNQQMAATTTTTASGKTRRPRLHSGTERVLEVARKNLSPMEVDLIESALEAGIRRHSGGIEQSAVNHFGTSDTQEAAVRPLDHLLEEEEPYDLSNSSPGLAPAADGHNFIQSTAVAPTTAAVSAGGGAATTISSSSGYDLSGAEQHLSEEELRQIQQALQDEVTTTAATGTRSDAAAAAADNTDMKPSPASGTTSSSTMPTAVSAEEAAAIERAIKEADDAEEARSLQLAFQMEEEEKQQLSLSNTTAGTGSRGHQQQPQGKVRTMTRAQWQAENSGLLENTGGIFGSSSGGGSTPSGLSNGPLHHNNNLPPHEDDDDAMMGPAVSAGFRMNSTTQQEWSRRDQNSVIGPNHEVRTKHDAELQAHANAHRLGVETDEKTGSLAHVGNKAYNAFRQSMKRNKTKGVATAGTGRAGSDASGTKGGAMDVAAREQISRAINAGVMNKLNGVVKEGKEAIIYHAEEGDGSEGFDVAVKVFKRIQEFKDRAEYVNGDPRYHGIVFQKNSSREQLQMWTEKEFRNLMRASRAGVPVATPLLQKDNILFMRFLGTDGWPAPQLREIDLRRGSKRWTVLYQQVVDAVRNLYLKARLVHGDLSEYNIMVVPAHLVENKADSIENEKEEVQAVLIDFGQAVDIRHPESASLLHRDLDRIESFFQRQGVETLGLEKLLSFVTESPRSINC